MTYTYFAQSTHNSMCNFVIFSGSFSIQTATLVPGSLEEHGQNIPVSRIYSHPNYYDVLGGYDIALLRLSYAPRIDNYTRPICLGSLESFQKVVEQGTDAECYITGNGYQERYVLDGILFYLDFAMHWCFVLLSVPLPVFSCGVLDDLQNHVFLVFIFC